MLMSGGLSPIPAPLPAAGHVDGKAVASVADEPALAPG